MEEYKKNLHSNNISWSFQKFLQDKLGSEEILITTTCQLTKDPIKIPIRHTPVNYINCIFDMDTWLEYYSLYEKGEKKIESYGVPCPGCRKYVNLKDYGIDFQLYNMLELKQLLIAKYPTYTFNHKQLFYYNSSNSYYIEYSYQQSMTEKIKVKKSGKMLLPGSNGVLGITRRKTQNIPQQLNPQQQRIYHELAYTIMKMQQLTNSKIYKLMKANSVKFQDLQQKVKQRKNEVKEAFQNSLKLVSLGKQSLTKDYIFSLKKINTNNILQSYLIVYYVQYGIWQEFPLSLNNQPYVQLELALYIKGEQQLNANEIFIIGGQKKERFQQSNQVLKITFPNDPFQQKAEAKIIELPSFPREGYHFMGANYKDNLFVFYGQIQFKNNDNQVKSQLLNCQFVFRKSQNKWEQLNNELCDRFDGSYFTVNHPQFEKFIVFYGGIKKEPDGLPNFRTTQQNKGQIFLCKDEKFFGGAKSEFEMQFLNAEPYVKCVLACPVFSCPYYGNYQLLLSGETLKHQNIEQRQIFSFDWAAGSIKLNEIFSLEPPEQILTPYRRKSVFEIFSPVHDPEGACAYGNFYVIYQQEQDTLFNEKSAKVVTSLLRINLTNGSFFSEPYVDSNVSKELAQNTLEKLDDRQNVVI